LARIFSRVVPCPLPGAAAATAEGGVGRELRGFTTALKVDMRMAASEAEAGSAGEQPAEE
jgi:hypothetical protein